MKNFFLLLAVAILGTTMCSAHISTHAIADCNQGTIIDIHDYVDLGLPSGTLWATCNVGADKQEDYGDYFAWGETAPQGSNRYSWPSYKWMILNQSSWEGCTKYTFADDQISGCWYNDSIYVGTTVDGVTYRNLTKLEAADDVATVNWGCEWCMPTNAQLKELMNSSYTTVTLTTQNGVYGILITSKMDGYTGKSIFLPAAGYRFNGELHCAGSYGRYWSSELNSTYSDHVWVLFFDTGTFNTSISNRCFGQSVRPVRSTAK